MVGLSIFKIFRFDERRFCAERRRELNHLLFHRLVRADAGILIRTQAGVQKQAGEFFFEPAQQFQKLPPASTAEDLNAP